MNKYTGSMLVLILLMTGSCKIATNTKLPETAIAGHFRYAPTDDDTATFAALHWDEFFTDAALRRLIDTALHNNYDMQIALKNIEAAQVQFRQVKWNYTPVIAAQVTTSTNRPSDNSLNGISLSQFLHTNHIEDYSAGLTLAWEADIWGKIRNQRKSALAAYLQTREARKLIQTNIVSGIAQGYYNLMMLDEQLLIARKNVTLTDSTLQMIRLQYNAGMVTALAVEYAVSQQLTAAALIPQMEQNIALQENALSILSGVLPDTILRTSDQVTFPAKLNTGIPADLLRHRPDIKNQELALVIARANTAINRASLYPSLRITAAGGVNAFKASSWFNIPASLFGTVAGSLAEPLLQHRELKTRYTISKIEQEKAVLVFRQTVLNAIGEVSDALVRIEKLRTSYQVSSSRVKTLQAATSNANLLFRNGMADYLEVITAESNVLQAELELAAIKRSEYSAMTDLYKALGGGWN